MDPDWTPPRGGQRYGEERGGSGAPCVTTRRSAAAGSSSQAAWPPSPRADLSSHADKDLFSDTDGTDENTDDEEEETPHAARRTPHAAAARRRPQAAGKRKAKAAPACEQDHKARARELAARRRERHEALLPPQKELRTAEARRLRAESERLPQPAPDDAEACGTFMDSVLGNYVGRLRAEGEARGATVRAGFTRTQTLVAGMPVPPRCRFVAGFDKINAARRVRAARLNEAAAAELARPPVAEAEGLRLHLSSSSSTRYRGVREIQSGRFKAEHKVDGRTVYFGSFDTAVEAAVAYARAVGEAPAAT